MRKPRVSSYILAENLRRIIGDQKVRTWAGNQKIKANANLARNVQRIIRSTTEPTGHSPSVDLLDQIAERCDLQAWHLLLPNLDPHNPPVLTMTATERDLYRRLTQAAKDLPDAP